ncbi:hypothetical protein DL766_001212 [Monosporascus sp. MC13-8B]|uniref:Uncharacterized protein n=1 Tax=Monosporascus cannonballus TaxID=155416 RepID=A0ABY0HDS8_9PEZI|nr:hypothetical protein DL762_002348 [Monosporascus cannonballus]RYO97456.1 hypothetical protein DL763_002724 [Monosporascus cannonballus]RYP38030.1 hypothetical protein DL766_001212 [Monosporascus sp. MC13-8B]
MMLPPSALYYTAAAIHAISIPGHIAFGHQHVDKAVDKIPASKELALGKATATTAWDMVNGMFATLALLNYQWARTGGPKTVEEVLIVWTTAATGFYVGLRYFKVNSYAGLGYLATTSNRGGEWFSSHPWGYQNLIHKNMSQLGKSTDTGDVVGVAWFGSDIDWPSGSMAGGLS